MGWIGIGLKALPLIFGAVSSIEAFFKAGKGQAKEDAAMEMFAHLLAATEGITGKELADDALVQDAARKVMVAVVAFQNVVRDVRAKSAAA